jgi:hypothetical protein
MAAGRLLLTGVLLLGLSSSPWARAPEQEKKEEARKASDEKAKPAKPRVITNADLEKYAKRNKQAPRVQTPPRPAAPPVEGPAEPPAPRTPGLPPEELLEAASLPELEDREQELATLVDYLKAKEAWLKNPFLPRPTPPPGEVLLTEGVSGADELQRTRTRIFATEGRLQKVRVLIQAGGGRL